jgi:hypothetical protein
MNWLREPNSEPLPGYRLIETLGTGGFGEVWKVEAPGGIFKAIKFVYGNLNSLDGDAMRAEQELKAMQRVKEVRHPFVISMERIDIVGGELIIVMELADRSLHDVLIEAQAGGQTGIHRDELLGYLRDSADGLDHIIEKHNLQHLDVKPRNLFLVSDRAKVADFGLVKQLERSNSSGMLGGVSPLYAAPETFGNKISKHSDQYSLAIVYVELLTGKRPFNGRNIRQLAIQHMTEEPDLSMLPERDRPVVARALSKDPVKRYPSCLAFVRALVSGKAEDGDRPLSRMSIDDLDLDQNRKPTVEVREAPHKLPPRPRPPVEDEEELGATIAQQDIGVLRPAILIGVGGFGRRALLELRCRLLDRFGDLNLVPAFRFLYIDSDPEAVRKAVGGAPEVALSSAEVFPLPLQPVANYRRRMLDYLNDWLPREKLYSIPRSLQPLGSRALGRLAFTDNYLRLMTRLRREIQVATHPESLAQAVSQTGLVLRDSVPRAFVFGAAGGGSSGFLTDLGYALQNLLVQMRFEQAPVTAFLFSGAPDDPATPKAEQANLYATLTELNHYSDPNITFSTQFGPDGPKLADENRPFASVYLLPTERRSPDAARDAIAHLAGYLAHDLTTAFGARLDVRRLSTPAETKTVFRSLCTHSTWYPRGLLLRVAARQVCGQLLTEWQAGQLAGPSPTVESACQRALGDTGLHWEMLREQLDRAANLSPDGPPTEALSRLVANLEEQYDQAGKLADQGQWARQVMDQVRDWVGTHSGSDHESLFRKSRLSRALAQAAQTLAERWEQRLSAQAFQLMEAPGRRLAAAETALTRMAQFCAEANTTQRGLIHQQALRTQQARAELAAAIDGVQSGGGFSLFGGRTQRAVRYYLDQVSAFVQQRLHEDIADAGGQFFHKLRGRLEERLRDLSFCRQRLAHLLQTLTAPMNQLDRLNSVSDWSHSPSPLPLADPMNEALHGSTTLQIVLPNGSTDLEQCALSFVQHLKPEHWTRLDQVLQALVMAPLGGLFLVCQKSSDLSRHLAGPLVDQAAAFLGELLPITDVAHVELTRLPIGASIADKIRGYLPLAKPVLSAADEKGLDTYLLVPNSDAGKNLAVQAQEAITGLQIITGTEPSHLMICREQSFIRRADLKGVLEACRAAYDDIAHTPSTSPHSRFDILEWTPIEDQ